MPAAASVELGSDVLVTVTAELATSVIGVVAAKVAVGATLFTVTAAVYSVKPSSLSMIRPFTVKRPLSAKAQLVEGLGAAAAEGGAGSEAVVALKGGWEAGGGGAPAGGGGGGGGAGRARGWGGWGR